MKKATLIFLLFSAILFLGFGCREENPDKTTNTFTLDDCPQVDWAERVDSTGIRGVGIYGTNTTRPDQLFTNEKDFGLRCFYYKEKGDPYEFNVEGGTVKGNYLYRYDMEIRRFVDKESLNEFNENHNIDFYCNYVDFETDVRGLGKTRLDKLWPNSLNGFREAHTDRFQCLWKLQQIDSTYSVNTSNSLYNFTDYWYKNAVITLRTEKDLGYYVKSGFSYDEDLLEQKQRIEDAIYNTEEFQKLPDKHEQELIEHLFNVLDQEIYREDINN